jgi:hypothetical protein
MTDHAHASDAQHVEQLPFVEADQLGGGVGDHVGEADAESGSDLAQISSGVAADAPTDIAADDKNCRQCGSPFTPRKRTGGKPQEFCTATCRTTWHAAHPKARASSDAPSPLSQVEAAKIAAPYVIEAVKATAGAATEAAQRNAKADDFDWTDKDDVICQAQPATAIYWNAANQVVLRQEAGPCDDHDPFLYFEPGNLPRLIERLQLEYDSWKNDSRG